MRLGLKGTELDRTTSGLSPASFSLHFSHICARPSKVKIDMVHRQEGNRQEKDVYNRRQCNIYERQRICVCVRARESDEFLSNILDFGRSVFSIFDDFILDGHYFVHDSR